MILDSKVIKYEVVDITEPGKESEKEKMQEKSSSKGVTIGDPTPRHALPPQLFYDDDYCGDYELFDQANEMDTLEDFLKLKPEERTSTSSIFLNTSEPPAVAAENGSGDAKPAEEV